MLKVNQETLENHGAVSEQTVREMVIGAANVLDTDLAISVSGIAGPGGATPGKPVGTVWTAYYIKGETKTKLLQLEGTREQIQNEACKLALEELFRYTSLI